MDNNQNQTQPQQYQDPFTPHPSNPGFAQTQQQVPVMNNDFNPVNATGSFPQPPASPQFGEMQNTQPMQQKPGNFGLPPIPSNVQSDFQMPQYQQYEKPVFQKSSGGGMGCKMWLFLIFIVVFISVGLTVYFQPPFILNPIKSYINADLGNDIPKYQEIEAISPANIQTYYSQENQSLMFSEDVVMSIMKNSASGLQVNRVEIQNGQISFFRNLSDKDYPLWFVLTVTNQNGKFELKKAGFGQFDLPDFIKQNVLQSMLDIANTGGDNEVVTKIIAQVASPEVASAIKAENLTFSDDLLSVKITEETIDSSEFFKQFDVLNSIPIPGGPTPAVPPTGVDNNEVKPN